MTSKVMVRQIRSLQERLKAVEEAVGEPADNGLNRDHWLISGRIDGIREALDMIRSPFSRSKIERLLEGRISELMKTDG